MRKLILHESFARAIFCPHTALKMCSNAHLPGVNCASARIFALSENKISLVQSSLHIKLLAGFLLFAYAFTAFAAGPLPRGIIKLDGRDAPALELKNLDGEKWNIDSARGHWVFLHFWASWCGPCRKEMPTIQAIISEFKGSRLEIVLINTAESDDTTFGFIGSIAPDLNSLLDSDGQVTERWQPRGLPSTFFIDPDGKLQYLALGGRAWNSPAYLAFLHTLIKQ